MSDEMRKIIDRIVPPVDVFGDPPAGGTGDAAAPGRNAQLSAEAKAEVTDEVLDAAEENLEAEDARDEADNLGIFSENDYAQRIAGWEFKSDDLYVDELERVIEVYYRRPLGSPAGTKWERIGHERSANALNLRRLIRCAELRDERAAEDRRRRKLIEGLFGPGTLPLVESLLAERSGDAAQAAALTPRQEAFCRHYLAEPSGTRAAILAGYAENGANVQAHRLLTNANIVQKISALRRAHALTYALDRDTMLDKLEAFFEDAMKGQSYSAALRALLAQAELSGLLNRRHKATDRAEARARATAEAEAAPQAPAEAERSR